MSDDFLEQLVRIQQMQVKGQVTLPVTRVGESLDDDYGAELAGLRIECFLKKRSKLRQGTDKVS